MNARRFLAELRTEVERHPAVNHLFLNRIATAPFSREDYRVLAENHYPLVCAFTSYLEALLVRAPASESKLWLAKVLVDEYGEGSRGEDHAALYAHFLAGCGGDADAVSGARVPLPALRFIAEHRRIVCEEPFLVGLGAVGPGHEWAIPKMFESLVTGLRRAGFTPAEIEYFTLHTAQDVDHGSWLEQALAGLADGEAAQREIRRGALQSLEARARFWTGVQSAVVRYRQPRAVRPDGARPRSLFHELALTAWDGSTFARRLELGVVRARERFRPTVAELRAGKKLAG
jgi:pyrroloquinoline quinone (PQQ) biosynthesis protein C